MRKRDKGEGSRETVGREVTIPVPHFKEEERFDY